MQPDRRTRAARHQAYSVGRRHPEDFAIEEINTLRALVNEPQRIHEDDLLPWERRRNLTAEAGN